MDDLAALNPRGWNVWGQTFNTPTEIGLCIIFSVVSHQLLGWWFWQNEKETWPAWYDSRFECRIIACGSQVFKYGTAMVPTCRVDSNKSCVGGQLFLGLWLCAEYMYMVGQNVRLGREKNGHVACEVCELFWVFSLVWILVLVKIIRRWHVVFHVVLVTWQSARDASCLTGL